MQAIAQEIVNNFGSEENMRKTIVEVGWLVDFGVGGSSHAPRTSVVDVGGCVG